LFWKINCKSDGKFAQRRFNLSVFSGWMVWFLTDTWLVIITFLQWHKAGCLLLRSVQGAWIMLYWRNSCILLSIFLGHYTSTPKLSNASETETELLLLIVNALAYSWFEYHGHRYSVLQGAGLGLSINLFLRILDCKGVSKLWFWASFFCQNLFGTSIICY